MRKWFGNLRVAGKLTLGFGVCLALAALNTWAALNGFGAARAAQRVTAEEALPRLSQISQIDIATRQARTYMIRLAGSEPGSIRDELTATLLRERSATTETISDYSKYIRSAEERALFQKVADDWRRYDDTWVRIEREFQTSPVAVRLDRLEKELAPIFVVDVRKDLTDLREWNNAYALRAQRDAEAVLSSAVQTVKYSFILSLAFGIGFAILVSTSITHPLAQIARGMKSLRSHCLKELQVGLAGFQKGDLTYAITSSTSMVEINRKDEIGEMATTFNESVLAVQAALDSYNASRHGLSDMVVRLSESAEAVAATSETLAASGQQSGAASNDIAVGSQKLASSASESAAIMDQLSAQAELVGQSSRTQKVHVSDAHRALDNAAGGISGVAAAAQNMAAVAVEGNDAVHRTIEAMSRVQDQANASSVKVQELDSHGRQIGEIVRTIAGIADQTNLLALNAAIEAARAGDHGRGFAVVAEEVRKLAEQASTSTREISALIQGVRETVEQTVVAIQATTREVANGVAQTEGSGRALAQILHSAEQVARQAESVAGLTENASQAMRSVATSVEENTTAAEEMARGTEKVVHSITSVASISEESAAGAEELSASIEQVGQAASELAAMSQDLQKLVGQFRVEGETKKKDQPRFAMAA